MNQDYETIKTETIQRVSRFIPLWKNRISLDPDTQLDIIINLKNELSISLLEAKTLYDLIKRLKAN